MKSSGTIYSLTKDLVQIHVARHILVNFHYYSTLALTASYSILFSEPILSNGLLQPGDQQTDPIEGVGGYCESLVQ